MNSREICDSFMRLHESQLTQEVCDKYYLVVKTVFLKLSSIVRKSPERRDEIMESFSKMYNGLFRIPTSMRSVTMCNDYFKDHRGEKNVFKFIPEDKITPYMCSEFFRIHKKSMDVFNYIPRGFVTNEMLEDFFYEHISDFDITTLIPREAISKKMYEDFFKQHISNIEVLDKIPREYITKEMALEYFMIHKKSARVLQKIPEELRDDEMYLEYARINNGSTTVINLVPKRILTKEWYVEYFRLQDSKGNVDFLRNIPEEYLEEDMIWDFFKKHMNSHLVFRYIPVKFITPSMVNTYFNYHKGGSKRCLLSLMRLPSHLITQEIVDEYYNKTGDISNILEEFRSSEICFDYFGRCLDISEIPEDKLTYDMVLEYFDINKDDILILDRIPTRMITREIVEEFYFVNKENDEVLEHIPRELITSDMIDEDISKYSIEVRKKLIYRELLLLADNKEGTLSEIAYRYKVSVRIVSGVLESLKEDNNKEYLIIKRVLKNNSDEYLKDMYDGLYSVTELLEDMGYTMGGSFNPDDKIYFSSELFLLQVKPSLYEMFDFVSTHKNGRDEFPLFYNFCRRVLKYERGRRSYNTWLHCFDIDSYFGSNKTLSINNGRQTVEITRSKAEDIIDLLKANQIYPNNCIVNEAFRRYAKDELGLFIIELQTGSYENEEDSEKVLVKE